MKGILMLKNEKVEKILAKSKYDFYDLCLILDCRVEDILVYEKDKE